jgi:hypothetical protein
VAEEFFVGEEGSSWERRDWERRDEDWERRDRSNIGGFT